VFEFLRVASLENQNIEALKEAYWIIVYIFLKKTMGIDISESLVQKQTDSDGEDITSKRISLSRLIWTSSINISQQFYK
jgi:hypothetical protein